ncbi:MULTISPECIES: trypsin-like serine protease [Pseudoalteromonas]|uniref:trypsin-like serine protease n=1 Tax=Pseudoalteromonas TaxID=53246 RepID=UPI000F783BAA|nr:MULTISPECIES: trypsin-like serine protease [Pseudoalteromonas]
MLKVKKTLSMTALSVSLGLGLSAAVVAQPANVGEHLLGGISTEYYEPEIVGGNPANTADWPFYTQILSSNGTTAFCGGSYVGDGYVLTAAHCVSGRSASGLNVKVAGFVLGGNDGDRIAVAEKYVHPQYNSSTLNHDIALLKLVRTPTQGSSVTLAQGNVEQYVRVGDLISVAGLGRLSEGGSRPTNLYEVDVPLVSDQVCRQSGGSYQNVGSVAFCAGYPEGQKDSCSGDSGGPIVANSGGQVVQLGIVSWGIGCARPAKYGVYSDVAALRSWIDSVKGGAEPVSVSFKANDTLTGFKVGETKAHTFTITNSGNTSFSFKTLNVTASGVTSGLVKPVDTCSASTLAANQSCQVGVEFGASRSGSAGVAVNFTLEESQVNYSAKATATVTSGGDTNCPGNWDANKVYDKPDQVTYQGFKYEARWWTRGDVPSESGTWGVWKLLGQDTSCTR